MVTSQVTRFTTQLTLWHSARSPGTLPPNHVTFGPYAFVKTLQETRGGAGGGKQKLPAHSSQFKLGVLVWGGGSWADSQSRPFLLPREGEQACKHCTCRYYHFNFDWGKITSCHSAQVPITKWTNCNNCCQRNKGLVAFLSRFQHHWELYTNVPIGQAGRN